MFLIFFHSIVILQIIFGLILATLTAAASSGSSAADGTFSPRVLLVDDNPDELFLREVTWKRVGFGQVTTSPDAEQAYRQLVQGYENGTPFSAVLSDLNMPRIDGAGLLKRVRNDSRFANIPFVITSDTSIEEIKKKYLNVFKQQRLSAFLPKSADDGMRARLLRTLIWPRRDEILWERLTTYLTQQNVKRLELITRINAISIATRTPISSIEKREAAFQSGAINFLREIESEIELLHAEPPETRLASATACLESSVSRFDFFAARQGIFPNSSEAEMIMRELTYTRVKLRIAKLIKKALSKAAMSCGALLTPQYSEFSDIQPVLFVEEMR